MRKRILVACGLAVVLGGCAGREEIIAAEECHHALSEQEVEAGWELLFDGKSLDNWRGFKSQSTPPGWASENGCLTLVDSTGDLITREQFANFELKLEWRISPAGNSGIFIRGDETGKAISSTGMEMQVLDNAAHLDRFWASHRAGAYYDMVAPPKDTSQPVGTWNLVHIIADGSDIEFKLNGVVTASFEVGSADWLARYKESKFSDRPNYGQRNKGHIALQDHWDKVWYRNIRILRLPD